MLIVKGMAALLLLAAQVLPARMLSIEAFGTFSYITSLLAVLSFVVVWGTDRYSLKEFSLDADTASRSDTLGENIFGVYSIVLINTAATSVILWLILKPHLETQHALGIVAVSTFILFARAISRVSSSITKGLQKVVCSEFVFSALRPLLFILGLGVLSLFSQTPTTVTVLLVFGTAYLCVFCITSFINLKVTGRVVKPKLGAIPTVYKMSFFFFLVGVGLPLMSNINTIQLGNMGTPDQVALYAASNKIVTLILLGLVSANLLISPKLSPLYYAGDIAGMRKLVRGNNAFVACLTVVPIVVILLFAEQVLSIFGEKYVEASDFLRVLTIGQAVSVFCGPVLLTGVMSGQQKASSIVVLTMCAVNWGLCVLLIPVLGTMGAVYASVIGNVLMNVILAVVVHRRIGLNVTMLNLLR